MGRIFAVTSGKGGVGKSTVSVGLGFAFAKKGKSVLLVDMDEGLRCLDLLLGVDRSAVFDLADVLMGKEIEDAVYSCEYAAKLSLIPAPAKTGQIDAFALTRFAREVRDIYDIVIFDFPAGMNLSFYSCLPEDTLFLTVAVPDPVSVRDAAAIGSALSQLSFSARLVINRFVYRQSRKYKHKNIDGMIDSAAIRLIGIVPESDELALLSLKHRLKSKGRAMRAFGRIAARLDGERLMLPKIKKI